MSLRDDMVVLASQAKTAARQLAVLTTDQKNACLQAMAEAIDHHGAIIQEANRKDMAVAKDMGISSALLDRLELTEKRIAGMSRGLREVAALPDPVGRILDERVHPNGLKLQKISTPIGVVVIIYESRPNVTADAASLCFKSGNATILRGGKEALNSNQAIARIMVEAARKQLPEFPAHAVQVVPTPDRQAIPELLGLTEYVDLCMPRGGEGLIRAVADCSKVPVIKHYKGVCHVYLDGEADPAMAESIALNAKLQRPAVCNAIETLLIDQAIADSLIPSIGRGLVEKGVAIRADERGLEILREAFKNAATAPKLQLATDQDFFTEYNDYEINLRVVDGLRMAIDHINHYGSSHSDSIVTKSEERALQFLAEVDSAAVYWNASTRFTDGGEFGMGAEIGISTDKVGARGPMGLAELTSYKWLGFGSGQIRT